MDLELTGFNAWKELLKKYMAHVKDALDETCVDTIHQYSDGVRFTVEEQRALEEIAYSIRYY